MGLAHCPLIRSRLAIHNASLAPTAQSLAWYTLRPSNHVSLTTPFTSSSGVSSTRATTKSALSPGRRLPVHVSEKHEYAEPWVAPATAWQTVSANCGFTAV